MSQTNDHTELLPEDICATGSGKATRIPFETDPDATVPLHVCFRCGGEMVYPIEWCEEGVRHWRIILRCPDCESRREGVFEQRMVEALDDELDRASGKLLGDLRDVTHVNMSQEVDFFTRALEADIITPNDF